MPGNSAGLVRAHRRIVLSASQDSYTLGAAYASGNAPSATYIYPNDRYLLADIAGFTKFTFTADLASGTVTGPQITFYGTLDPATAAGLNSSAGTGSWFPLSAPGENAGTGTVVNPITVLGPAGTQSLQFQGQLLAWRVTSNGYTGGGTVAVSMIALP